MNLEFSRQIFKYKISWKSVQWLTNFFHADGQTDRHDEAYSRFSKFYELVYKTKVWSTVILLSAGVAIYYESKKYYERFIYIFIVSDTSHNFK